MQGAWHRGRLLSLLPVVRKRRTVMTMMMQSPVPG